MSKNAVGVSHGHRGVGRGVTPSDRLCSPCYILQACATFNDATLFLSASAKQAVLKVAVLESFMILVC